MKYVITIPENTKELIVEVNGISYTTEATVTLTEVNGRLHIGAVSGMNGNVTIVLRGKAKYPNGMYATIPEDYVPAGKLGLEIKFSENGGVKLLIQADP